MTKHPNILTALGFALLLAVAAVFISCSKAPVEPGMGKNCLECHRTPNIHTNEGVAELNTFCRDCHADAKRSRKMVGDRPVDLSLAAGDLETGPHRNTSCLHCHGDVARSPHKSETGATCDGCHAPHGEATAHAPHVRVDCQACHANYPTVMLDTAVDRVRLQRIDAAGVPIALTDHRLSDASDPETCQRCHHDNNKVGAPAAVLPAKSGLCMLCHHSPLSIGHPMFGAAALVFVIGILVMLRFWFQGSVRGEERSMHRKVALGSDAVWETIFSKRIFTLLKVFVLDIVLQRRILKESVQRWAMHTLIFSAIMLRLALALFTAVVFRLAPDSGLAALLIDKNHYFTAFANDFLGLMILLGVLWAVIQRYLIKPSHVVAEIEDNLTIALVGLLIVIGFALEAVRILMTQIPADTAVYSFVGYALARILAPLQLDLVGIYGYLWYAHALFGAAFVAYLPFGKLRHVFNTPLTYFLEAVSGVKNVKRV